MNPKIFIIVVLTALVYSCEKDSREEIDPVEKPYAFFSVSPSQGKAPLEVYFDSDGSNMGSARLKTFSWYFGDGKKDIGSSGYHPAIYHTYEEEGEYTAKLEITDIEGNTSSYTQTIMVEEGIRLFPSKAGSKWKYKLTRITGNSSDGKKTKIDYFTVEIENYYEQEKLSYVKVYGLPSGSGIDDSFWIKESTNKLEIAKLRYEDEHNKYHNILVTNNYSRRVYARYFHPEFSDFLSMSTFNLDIGDDYKDILGDIGWSLYGSKDNWGEKYQTERFEYKYYEYYVPLVGFLKSYYSYYINYLTCTFCPVYFGETIIELEAYAVFDSKGNLFTEGEF